MNIQQIRLMFAGQIAIIIALVLSGCGGDQKDTPRATVDDPRAYAIAALQTMDLNAWWQAYRNTDPELLGQIVDDVAEKLPDGLPTDARKLDTLIRNRIVSSYRLYMSDTDEGKAYILARAEERFADPPMALWDEQGNYALLDYHILPGEWTFVSRVSEGLANSPAVGKKPFLQPDVLALSLQRLVEAYPDARVYQIRYQYHAGSDLKKITMSFVPDGQITYKEGGRLSYTATPVAWDDLLEARIDLATLDWDQPMEGESGPSLDAPPDEPLPFQNSYGAIPPKNHKIVSMRQGKL